MMRSFAFVESLLLGTAALLSVGCPNEPLQKAAQGDRAKVTPNAADSSWEWVYVPHELQSTYGTGVVADVGGAYVAGFFDAGYDGKEPDPHWGDHRLERRGEMNFFVARHGADGSILWARRYGDGGRISVSDLAQGPDGSLYLCRRWRETRIMNAPAA